MPTDMSDSPTSQKVDSIFSTMSALRNRKFDKARYSDGRGKEVPPITGLESGMDYLRRQPLWIVLAVASGTCAAINGVFAKLSANTVGICESLLTLTQAPRPP